MKKRYSLTDDLILIDLGSVKAENIARLLEDNDMVGRFDADKLIELKSRGIDKVYIDAKSNRTMATVYADEPLKVCFTVDFMAQMLDMKGIKFAGGQKKANQGTQSLSVDAILDKINESGFASLTAEEKEFLSKN